MPLGLIFILKINMIYLHFNVCFLIWNVSVLSPSKDADPQFELKVELWSCALEDELTMVNTPKKLAKKLRSSFGKTAGKKLCPLLDSPDPDTFLQYNPIPPYVLCYPIEPFTDSWLPF